MVGRRQAGMAPPLALGVAALVLALGCRGQAHSGRRLVTFGASTTDDGTGFYPQLLSALVQTFQQRLSPADAAAQAQLYAQPAPPYVNHTFNNGAMAPMVIAQKLGLTLVNYAVGGAGTGGNAVAPLYYPIIVRQRVQATLDKAFPGQYRFVGVPDSTLLGQAALYISQQQGGRLDPAALHYLSFDATDNDIYSLLIQMPAATPAQEAAFVEGVMAATRRLLFTLFDAGARKFVVVASPDLSITPLVRLLGAGAMAQSLRLQEQLERQQKALADEFKAYCARQGSSDASFFFFRQTSDIFNAAAAGLINERDPCYPVQVPGFAEPGVAPCADPGKYEFWDTIHPTAKIAEIVGNLVIATAPNTLLFGH